MSITLTAATLPVFKAGLMSLSHCLSKAAAHAASRGFSPDAFVSLKLAPDMLPFASQIRIACDSAKNATARVSGLEAPRFADDETTFAQLQARIQSTLAWLETVPVDAFDGREAENITFPVGRENTRTLPGEAYLKHHALPNFFFHLVTAYNLLRHGGVDLGKKDYLMGSEA
ncbi:MAG: DUF1993 domain-containing protein [Betaproteobacteria bacterium]|nr:DUF1993 domain-containing protein [Betaproteobacteria bacterium]NBT09495.1 DUF1993 domain-containing protein [Betaproteobacteria bacterium]